MQYTFKSFARDAMMLVAYATCWWLFLSLIRWAFGAVVAAWVSLIVVVGCLGFLMAMFVPPSWLGRDEE